MSGVWHGASEVMGGLLVTLALNVVDGLPTYTNYALNLIYSLMRMTEQGSPKKSSHGAETCPPAMKKSKVLVIEGVHQR